MASISQLSILDRGHWVWPRLHFHNTQNFDLLIFHAALNWHTLFCLALFWQRRFFTVTHLLQHSVMTNSILSLSVPTQHSLTMNYMYLNNCHIQYYNSTSVSYWTIFLLHIFCFKEWFSANHFLLEITSWNLVHKQVKFLVVSKCSNVFVFNLILPDH